MADLPLQGVDEIEWECSLARSRAPSLRVGQRAVHSAYDPVREARQLASAIQAELSRSPAGLVIQIGAGLGYLQEALAARIDLPIHIWDPFPGISAKLAAQSSALGPRVRMFHDARALDALLKEAAGKRKRPHVVIHPGYQETARFEAHYAAWSVRKHFLPGLGLSLGEALINRRALQSLLRLPYLGNVGRLRGLLKDRTAVIVSAGPSLQAALGLLKSKPRPVLFCAIQALRPLNQAGIEPDFVACPDPQDFISDAFLSGFTPRFGALLAESAVQPSLLDRFADRTHLFHLRSSMLPQIAWERAGVDVQDEPFMTVSESILMLSRYMGARRILLLGVDYHAEDPRYPVRFRTQNIDGQVCWTNSHYFHGARYMDMRCKELVGEGCELFRFSQGLPIRAATRVSLDELGALLASAAAEPRVEIPAPIPSPDLWQECRTLLQEALAACRAGHLTPLLTDLWSHVPDFQALPENTRIQALEDTLSRLEERPV